MDDLSDWPPPGVSRLQWKPFTRYEELSTEGKAKLRQFFDSMLSIAANKTTSVKQDLDNAIEAVGGISALSEVISVLGSERGKWRASVQNMLLTNAISC